MGILGFERNRNKRDLNLHGKLNNSNQVIWNSMIEDFLTIKDLLETFKDEETRSKDISNLEWKKDYQKDNCLR